MTDPSITRLRDRLDRFHDSGDITGLLGDDVLAEIGALAGKADLVHDLTAVELVAWLYWYRSLALPGERAVAERESATKLFELVYVSDPRAVPGPLQDVLRERRTAKQAEFIKSAPFHAPAMDVQQELRRAGEQFQRFHQTNDRATLDDAIAGFQRLRTAMPAGSMLRPLVCVMYGMGLMMLFERTSTPQVLTEAIASLREGVQTLPVEHEMRPAAVFSLAGALQMQAMLMGPPSPELRAEIADLVRQASQGAPPGTPMSNLIKMASGLIDVMDPASEGDPGGMDQAIDVARQMLGQTPPGDPKRPYAVMNLGLALASRFEVTRMADTMDEGIALLREADAALPADEPQRPTLRGMLGAALAEMSRQRGDPAMTEESVSLLRAALAATEPTHALYTIFMSHLAIVLWYQYLDTGRASELDEAIRIGRQAVDATPHDSPVRPALLHNLSAALHDWHRLTGDLGALRGSVDLAREAERTADSRSQEYRHAMLSLMIGLILLYRRTREPELAREAVTWGRRILGEVPQDHPERLTYAVGVAQALQDAAETGDTAQLDEAVALLQNEAYTLVAREHTPGDLQYVANALAATLLQRSLAAPDLRDVDDAIGWLRRATTDTAPSPDRERCLGLLAQALKRRSELARDRAALAEALTILSTAPAAELPPALRVRTSLEAGRIAAALGDWPGALDGFSDAVAGLPQVAHRRLDRADREFGLTMLTGLAAEAAACALNAKQPERAAELLERGRGVLLAQLLEMKDDLDDLASTDPGRAARLVDLRDQLDALDRLPLSSAGERADTQAAGRRAERRQSLAAEWDELVAEVRRQGNVGFLRPPRFTDMAAQANEGPVVLLNVSRHRSDALLLTRDGLDVVHLRAERLLEQLGEHTAAFARSIGHVHSDDEAQKAKARSELDDMLGWLWDDIAEPVLGRLGLLNPGTEPRRVWWCPVGPLTMLPIHAAGRDGTAVIDYVISSYTPTVRALRHARQCRTAPDPARGMLVVAMSQTPGQKDLRGVAEEMKWLRGTFGGRKLLNTEATRDRILAELGRYPIAHFACHGSMDLERPSESRLLCHDYQEHPLAVADVARLNLSGAALAYLSACSVARTTGNLADECLHMATAFQLAGYAQVVGTLWNVDDDASTRVTRRFYEALSGSTGTARALHEAVQAIRADSVHAAIWAPYIHVGS